MAAVSSVAENFNSYDPGRPRIDTAEPSVGAAIRRLRDRPLAEFHQCLVDISEKSDGGPPA
jgi:hypothetical protein